MSIREVYIRGKFDDLEDVIKLARAQARKIFNLKQRVNVKQIQKTRSGYLVDVVCQGVAEPSRVEGMRKQHCEIK